MKVLLVEEIEATLFKVINAQNDNASERSKLTDHEKSVMSSNLDLRIADLSFSFSNSWVINMLKDRADAVKRNNWDLVGRINTTMGTKISDKYLELVVPVGAYVTMTDEDAYNRFCKLPDDKLPLFGELSKVKTAEEPTNIIWENQDFSEKARATRYIYVVLILLGIFFGVFVLSFQIRLAARQSLERYDLSINCRELERIYQPAEFASLAVEEWESYYLLGGA